MHPIRRIIQTLFCSRLAAGALTLSAVLGAVGVSAAYGGEYTLHGSSCTFFSNTQTGNVHVETGIHADQAAQVTCPLIRLDRQDKTLARVEVDYASGPGGGDSFCRLFAISDLGSVSFGPALTFTPEPHLNFWLNFYEEYGETPAAQDNYSTYAVDCTLRQGASIHGLTVME